MNLIFSGLFYFGFLKFAALTSVNLNAFVIIIVE